MSSHFALHALQLQRMNRHSLDHSTHRKPETHVVQHSGGTCYAFYAPHWNGEVELRGLVAGKYRVRDYFNDRELGIVSTSSSKAMIHVAFHNFLLIEVSAA